MDILKDDFNFYHFTVDKAMKNKEFLKKINLSSRYIRRSVREKNIFVNGKLILQNIDLKPGDIVSIKIEEEELNAIAEEKELDIVYEDNDLLIVNKEPGIIAHAVNVEQRGTLSNYLAGYFLKNNIKRKIRLVNRLDRDTSGLIIVAKNSNAHSQLAKQMEEGKIIKKYMAIVEGVIDQETIIEKNILRSEDGIKRIVDQRGQYAKTLVKPIKTFNNMTLAEVQLFTGRTHQIRVHLNYIGHSLVGDHLYGNPSPLIKRQALHSYYLKFNHPRTNKILEIKGELPCDMKALIM